MVKRMKGQKKQLSIERRQKQNIELEALVHPNHTEQLDSIIRKVHSGEMGADEAIFAARQVLIEVASIDTKTGLKKAEALKIRLEPLMRYAERSQTPLIIVYIDGDDFKEINDTLGHDVGDVAIFALAQAIKNSTRDSDLQSRLQDEGPITEEETDLDKEHARMGGDEFTIVLPDTTAQEAQSVVLPRTKSRFREIAASDLPEYQDRFGHPVTFSAGIAEFDPRIDLTPADFITRAETAMRHAKETKQSNGVTLSQYNPESHQIEHQSL